MEAVHSQASYANCLICLERYQKPKVLPCGHTFCLGCIQKMVEKSFMQCPKCQDKFTLPASGKAKDLPTNYELLKAIEDREAESMTTREGPSQQEGLQSKDHCILHDNPYEFFCKSCTKQACTKCLLDDHKPGNHIIVTRNDFINEASTELEDTMRTLRSLRLTESALNEKLAKAFHSCRGELKEIEGKILGTLEDKIQKLRGAAQKLIKEAIAKSNVQLTILDQLQAKQKELGVNLQETQSNCVLMKARLTGHDLTQPIKLDEVKHSVSDLSKDVESLGQACMSVPSKLDIDFLPETVRTTTAVGTLVYSGNQTYFQLVRQKTNMIVAYFLLLFIFAIQIFVILLVGKRGASIVPMFSNMPSKHNIIDCAFKTKSQKGGKSGYKSLVHLHRLGEAFCN